MDKVDNMQEQMSYISGEEMLKIKPTVTEMKKATDGWGKQQ